MDSIAQAPATTNEARRSFFKRSAALAGGAIAGVSLLDLTEQHAVAQSSRTSLNAQMKLVQRHENDHVSFLREALGSSARPKPTFQNIRTANLFEFLTLSRALENTGVAAYLGATPFIFNRETLAAAGSIAFIEARHAGFLNSLTSRPMTENVFGGESSFERAGTLQEVVTIAGTYISSLNGGPPLEFSTTPSARNDIAILNFALALEYLEAEYYNINVPIYYP